MRRFAWFAAGTDVMVSTSLAELLAVLGSMVPEGTATVAVFVKLPELEPEPNVPVSVMVADPDGARLSVVAALLRLALLKAPQLEPGVAEHVRLVTVSRDGTVSVNAAPVTGFGPRLVTAIV